MNQSPSTEYRKTKPVITYEDFNGVRVLTLAHPKETNPYAPEMRNALVEEFRKAEVEPGVKALVLYGGRDRSFSAGGDFNETIEISNDQQADEWIDSATDVYLAIVNCSKPTVCAVDNFAIGMGFQVALMFDWRVMSTRAQFLMPELEHGIGASMASAILTTTSGYDVARRIVMSCQPIHSHEALEMRLVDEVTESDFLLERAIARASRLGGYPPQNFSNTKKVLNSVLRAALEDSREQSKRVHRAAFADTSMHAHFNRVLHRGHQDGGGA